MSVGRVGCLKLSDPQEQIATLAEVWRHSGLNNKAVFLSSFGRKVPFVFSFFLALWNVVAFQQLQVVDEEDFNAEEAQLRRDFGTWSSLGMSLKLIFLCAGHHSTRSWVP